MTSDFEARYRGPLVVLWFSTLVRERSSGASVSMFIVVVK